MKSLIFLVLLVAYLHWSSARLHSMKYFVTGSTEVPNFPEFVAVDLVDDVQTIHYDSNTRRAAPKQDWMDTAVSPQFWDVMTPIFLNVQQLFKANVRILKHLFNQTGGLHIYQVMHGCEWDDETEALSPFFQFGFDGEDFMSFDLKTETWITPKPQAVLTKQEWDKEEALTGETKFILTQICPDWLKKFLYYGKDSLMRTDLPSVTLLQKTSSSPVRCFAIIGSGLV